MADFETILGRLDEGFQVELIAQPVDVFRADTPLDEVRRAAEKKKHDVAFIGRERSDQLSVGVEKVFELGPRMVRDVRPSDLVSASMPISSVIPLMIEKPFALVLTGDRVTTLVTRADLNLLPVRVMLFTVMSHAEMLLREEIGRVLPVDAWMRVLSKGQRDRIERLQAEKIKHDADTRLLDCTSLGQKCEVVAKVPELWKAVGCGENSEFQEERKAFQRLRDRLFHHQELTPTRSDGVASGYEDPPEDSLRDALAHNGRFIAAQEGVRALAEVVVILRRWIRVLT